MTSSPLGAITIVPRSAAMDRTGGSFVDRPAAFSDPRLFMFQPEQRTSIPETEQAVGSETQPPWFYRRLKAYGFFR